MTDEGRHPVGPERLWNESWYFDLVDEDAGLGAYVRLGLYPNMGVAWYTAYVTGPERPCVALVDVRAPLPPGEDLRVRTAAYAASHVCEAPWERFRVQLRGTGAAHRDHAAPLRAEQGEPVGVALDLEWETDGEPYRYSRATRYEVPCMVRGTVEVGDERLEVHCPGQRDHSWGVRDWWAADWMWSSARLDDGRRLHALDFRLHDGRHFPVGYLQGSGGPLVELEAVRAEEEIADDGLIRSAQIAVEPGGLQFDVEPLGFGPLLIVDDDGRTTFFPRAMCRFTAADGLRGVGWVEWARNVSQTAERPGA
jgi:hypothetical protein